MSRRLLCILLLLMMPVVAFAAEPTAEDHGQAAAEGEHGEAAAGEHHEKVYFGFLPAWVLKLLNMVLFFGILAYFIGGPLKRALGARNAQVRQEAEEARARRAKADQLAGDIQARLTQIEQEVQAIHERARIEGERQKSELLAAAEAEAAKILQAARNEVDNRLKHARKELTDYASELAAQRAEAILREKITPEDQKNLFGESVAEVGGGRS